MRSQTFVGEERTDLTARPLARRAPIVVTVAIALGLFAISGALTFGAAGRHNAVDPATSIALEAEAKGIASALDANARAAYQRAVDIATTPMVRAAILTDTATVKDMAENEFQFKPIHGEAFELYQVDAAKTTFLIRMPAAAPPVGTVGEHEKRLVNNGNGNINIVVGVPIARIKEGSGYKDDVTGMLTLSFIVDLAFVKQALAAYATHASLVGLDQPPLVLVDQAGPAEKPIRVPVTLDEEWKQRGLELEVQPKTTLTRAGWANPVRYASAALGAALLIGLAGALAVRRRAT